MDLYPTLAELAGLPAPAGLDGRSFARVLDDPAAPARDHIIHVYPRGNRLGRAIRTARHRLVEWREFGADESSAEWELYDYQDDPLEKRNLAAERPEVVKELRALLAKHPAPVPPGGARGTAKPGGRDRGAMFKERDKDGDGSLTREEFLANQPDPQEAPKRFTLFDKNNDGRLSRDEFVSAGK